MQQPEWEYCGYLAYAVEMTKREARKAVFGRGP